MVELPKVVCCAIVVLGSILDCSLADDSPKFAGPAASETRQVFASSATALPKESAFTTVRELGVATDYIPGSHVQLQSREHSHRQSTSGPLLQDTTVTEIVIFANYLTRNIPIKLPNSNSTTSSMLVCWKYGIDSGVGTAALTTWATQKPLGYKETIEISVVGVNITAFPFLVNDSNACDDEVVIPGQNSSTAGPAVLSCFGNNMQDTIAVAFEYNHRVIFGYPPCIQPSNFNSTTGIIDVFGHFSIDAGTCSLFEYFESSPFGTPIWYGLTIGRYPYTPFQNCDAASSPGFPNITFSAFCSFSESPGSAVVQLRTKFLGCSGFYNPVFLIGTAEDSDAYPLELHQIRYSACTSGCFAMVRPNTEDGKDDNDKLSPGVIAGISIGAVVGVGLLGIGLYLLAKRIKRGPTSSAHPEGYVQEDL